MEKSSTSPVGQERDDHEHALRHCSIRISQKIRRARMFQLTDPKGYAAPLSMLVVDLMAMTCCVIILDNCAEELEDTFGDYFASTSNQINRHRSAYIKVNK